MSHTYTHAHTHTHKHMHTHTLTHTHNNCTQPLKNIHYWVEGIDLQIF